MSQLSFDTTRMLSKTGTFLQESPLSFVSDLEKGQIAGHVEKVVFFNSQTGQCLLDVKTEGAKSHFMLASFVPFVAAGQSIFAQADVALYDGYEQIVVTKLVHLGPPLLPRTLKKFLKSPAMSELSKTLANSLVEKFPENLFSILELDPKRLSEAEGIGEKRRLQIIEAWEKLKSLKQFRELLFREHLPLEWAERLWPVFGAEMEEVFLKNPYKVSRELTLPFDLVDAFALRKGFPIESEERVRSGLVDLLQNFYKQGHCAYPEQKLLEEAQRLLHCSPELIESSLEIELIEKRFVDDTIGGMPCIYLHEVWLIERNVAEKLLELRERAPPWGWFHFEKVLSWAQNLLNIQLAPLQKEAIETALSSSLTVITGGPGTGKTTLVRSLTTIIQTQHLRFALCSPTGRAAKRLEETTGHPAQTIHRLLKLHPLTGEFVFNRQNLLDVDLVLVDETSMVDISLMNSLLEALPAHAALILVGDVDQIPPVGAGSILQSMIDSNRFTIVCLKEIFRQSEESLIKINSLRINAGEMPLKSDLQSSDFHYLPVHSNEEAKAMVFDLATRVIPNEYGIKDMKQVQILVPMNTGTLGTQKLNQELQQQFSGGGTSRGRIVGFDQSFVKGDKVMVIKNDYKKGLYNGDIGFIQKTDPVHQYLDIEFDDRVIRFDFEELEHLSLAYAISIHKSQGSEYKAVIVVITSEHLPMAQRHLIYTAVTRGKEHVFLVAEPRALQTAVSSDENNRRWQKLTELLSAAPSGH